MINLQIDPDTDGQAARIAFSMVVILDEETTAENNEITANPQPKASVHPVNYL